MFVDLGITTRPVFENLWLGKTVLLWMLFAILCGKYVAADIQDDGDDPDDFEDFTDNLISDLAPLLALFGERATMQFMSQSMGWADNILLAMAPLGIITIIVSTIRVGGPSWLKSIVGRARENLATAEIELMSSTSKEVCEVWNGKELVRCMGSCPVVEFILLVPKDSTKINAQTVPNILTINMDKAVAAGYLQKVNKSKGTNDANNGPGNYDVESGNASSTIKKPDIVVVRNTTAAAPNISLNCHGQAKRVEIQIFAIVGTIIQLGVIIYSGCATYHPMLSFPRNGHSIAGYAFPCTAIGALVLVVGMMLCAHVVESSTDEMEYRLPGERHAYMVWLQRTTTVSDQSFQSYALYTKEKQDLIITSERAPPSSFEAELKVKTIVGAILGLGGFIIQFIGLRGMHWSASLAQLGSVLIMTVLRAWVRRGLARPPGHEQLRPGFELDWLTQTLSNYSEAPWHSTTQYKTENKIASSEAKNMFDYTKRKVETIDEASKWSGGTDSTAHKMMIIRRDLARLSCWRGKFAEEADSVAKAIKVAMNTLFASTDSPSTLGAASPADFPDSVEPTSATAWLYNHFKPRNLYFDSQPENSKTLKGPCKWPIFTNDQGPICLTIKQEEDNKWNVDWEEVEAVLSRWLFSVDKDENEEKNDRREGSSPSQGPKDDMWLRAQTSVAKPSLRLLGAYDQGLHRDLFWWMPTNLTKILKIEEDGNGKLKVETHRVVGQGFKLDDPRTSQTQNGEAKFGNIELTNPVFAGDQEAEKRRNSLLAMMSHSPLSVVYAQDLFSAFMWAAAQWPSAGIKGAANIQIDDAKVSDNLHNLTLHHESLSKMALEIHSTHLGSLEDVYLSIIPPLSMMGKLPLADPVIELVQRKASVQEQLRHWSEAHDLYLWLFRVAKTFPNEIYFVSKATALTLEYLRVVDEAISFGKNQLDDHDLKLLETVKSSLEDELKSGDQGILSGLMLSYNRQKRHWQHGLGNIESVQSLPPTFGFTKLHATVCELNFAKYSGKDIMEVTFAANPSPKDIHDWTPLHYATAMGNDKMSTALYKADMNAGDLLGWTPLHYACKRGSDVDVPAIKRLISWGANVNAEGRDGVTPLHCVAMNGSRSAALTLIEAGATVNIMDGTRTTPLLWAAYKGTKEVFELLYHNANRNLRNRIGRTVLHLAVLGGQGKIVTWLHATKTQDFQAVDKWNKTPLHLAAEKGDKTMISLLIKLGANKEAKDWLERTPVECLKDEALHARALFA